MSYILEALKKAQAERQLGNAPTIHAPQPVQAAEPGAVASRKPLFIGLGAGALVVAAGALFMWQRGSAPAAVAVPAPAVAAAPAVAGRESAATASPCAAAGAASNTLEVSAPPEPVAPPHPAHAAEPRVEEAPARHAPSVAGRAGADARTPAPVSGPAAAPASAPAVAPALPAVRTAPVAVAPRAAATPAPAPASVPAPAPEDSLPYLHQLPDTIQRDIPRVSFGGYMYSANPADRLLLVDKALRHEGEEVGPGLVLEKLLPKAAVMNYRGVRYRVAY
jgi:general secretion pathway protein B